jgi:hypothetical protein
MHDASAPTADWSYDELITRIAELSSGFVIRWKVSLAIATDADPPLTGSIAPAVAAGRNERRSQLIRVELDGEKLSERAEIDRRIGQKHQAMLGRDHSAAHRAIS